MKKIVAGTAVMLAMTMVCAAGYLAQAPAGARSDSAELRGIVRRADGRTPLSGASVELRNPRGAASWLPGGNVTTDSAGRFVIPDVSPGTYYIRAQRAGYLDGEYGQTDPRGWGKPILLAAGEDRSDIVIDLAPGGVISGRVYDRYYAPITGGAVQAFRYGYEAGRRVLIPGPRATSNDVGEYRLFGMTPGEYIVSLNLPGNSTIPIFYPAGFDIPTASVLLLEPGTVLVGIDITAPEPPSGFRVQGHFVGANGEPIRATIMLMRRGGIGADPLRAVGPSFEFQGVLPGVYDLIAQANNAGGLLMDALRSRSPEFIASFADLVERSGGFSQALQEASETQALWETLVVGYGNVENLELRLKPNIVLSGRVRNGMSDGVYNVPGGSSVELKIESPSATMGWSALNRSATVQPDGNFRINRLVQGATYRLTVAGGASGWYVQEARLDGRDVLETGLQMQAPGDLEVVLAVSSGRVDVRVLDDRGQALPGAVAVLVPDMRRRNRLDLYRWSRTDEAGQAAFASVVPGEYKVFAWNVVEPNAWENAEFIARFEVRGVPIRVVEDARVAADVNVSPPGI